MTANLATLFGAMLAGRAAWSLSYDPAITIAAALAGALLGALAGTLAAPHQ